MSDTLTGDGLTLAGLPVPVVEGSWVRRPDFRIGSRVRAKDGTLRSTEAGGSVYPSFGSKRVWDCQVDVYDQTAEDALRAACPLGQAITIAGYLPAGTFSAVVDVGDVATATVTIDGALTIIRTAALHLEVV